MLLSFGRPEMEGGRREGKQKGATHTACDDTTEDRGQRAELRLSEEGKGRGADQTTAETLGVLTPN